MNRPTHPEPLGTHPPAKPAAKCWMRSGLTMAFLAVLCGAVMVMPSPAGLTREGQRVLGIALLAIALAMSIGKINGLNPVICGLIVMIAGDAVLYYPAQSASSLVVYERGYLSAPEIFCFGVLMTLAAFVVVMAVALPYWSLVGEPLVAK